MFRYTTPTISLSLSDINFSEVDTLRVVFKQEGRNGFVKVYKSNNEGTDIIITNNIAEITLTAEETGSFKAGKVCVQGHIKLNDGTILATNMSTLTVVDILDEVTMEDD